MTDMTQDRRMTARAGAEGEDEYYRCSKLVRFPATRVTEAAYEYFLDRNVETATLNELYAHLGQKFGVKSFNKANLAKLLGAGSSVRLEDVKDRYVETVRASEAKIRFDADAVTQFFVDCGHMLRRDISELGPNAAKRALAFRARPYDSACAGLTNDDLEAVCEIVDFAIERDWFGNADEMRAEVEKRLAEKAARIEKLSYKNAFLFYLKDAKEDNLGIRLRYLFPDGAARACEKHGMRVVADLKGLTDESAIDLYEHRDAVLSAVKKLRASLHDYLNERFERMVKLSNKSGAPSALWRKYVAILEARAEKRTLGEIGAEYGVTKERVRQLCKKYVALFNEFYKANGGLGNLIRSAVADVLFVTNEDMRELFSFNPKIFKFLLMSSDVGDLAYVEEIDKFRFVDELDWYGDLVKLGEGMPEQIRADAIDGRVDKALGELAAKGARISREDCRKILLREYRPTGEIWSRARMSLAMKIKTIMAKYFPRPVNIYDPKFISEFRRIYKNAYGVDELKSDHAVQTTIGRKGMLVGRGTYVANDRMFMSEELARDIEEYMLKSDRAIFLTNNLFMLFETRLRAEGIDNKYFLQGAFKQRRGDKFFFRRDYISKTEDATNAYGEICDFIRDSKRIVAFKELQAEFKGYPKNILTVAVAQDGILNYMAKYVAIETLGLTESDKSRLRSAVARATSGGAIRHSDDILAKLRAESPDLLVKLRASEQFALFSAMECLFGGEFEFKRPFVAKKGVKIDSQRDRIKKFVEASDELAIDKITAFVAANRLHMYSICEFVDSLDAYAFKNSTEIIALSKANLTRENAEIAEGLVLRAMNGASTVYADKLDLGDSYPREVAWTPWLLYSALNKFGRTLKAIPSDARHKFRDCVCARPLIIRRDAPASDAKESLERSGKSRNRPARPVE